MCAAGHTGGASTLTCTLDVGNGSVSIIKTLPNCPATSGAVDEPPSGMSHDCGGIAFLESCCAHCSDGFAPVDVTSSTLSCESCGFLVRDTTPFYPVDKALSFPSSGLLDHTVEGLDWSSLTLGEACVVTCGDRDTAAGDTEITMTCVVDQELTSMLLKSSHHSCQWVLGDLRALMPPSIANHRRPMTVPGKPPIARATMQRFLGRQPPLY